MFYMGLYFMSFNMKHTLHTTSPQFLSFHFPFHRPPFVNVSHNNGSTMFDYPLILLSKQ